MTLDALPAEVLNRIIKFTLPLEIACPGDVDNEHSHPFALSVQRCPRAHVAKNLSPVCKTLYHAAMPVIWEHVIVDSTRRLSTVGAAIEGHPHVGNFTRRLEVRVGSRYSLRKLISVIKAMHGLKTFIVGQLGPTNLSPPPLPTVILKTLAAASPTIERLQFSGRGEAPTLKHMSLINRSFKQLRSLQFNHLATQCEDYTPTTKQFFFSQLTTLSIGDRDGVSQTDQLDRFLRRVRHANALPSLRRFDVFSDTPLLPFFFLVHGHKMEHVSYSTDSHYMLKDPYLLDHCNKVETLTIAANWLSADLQPSKNPFPSFTLVRRINIIRHDYKTTWDCADLVLGFILIRQWPFLERVYLDPQGLLINLNDFHFKPPFSGVRQIG
ncbi:hypothetical protein FA13DRAFT_1786257 [Coprinellus micaceus]|uniref:F-box domain-containing protein n=1 Tax=Coprinellus micaceus TaxID=71717 RepID=A0A4Y7TY45_COPMI|nr:hypothetical protein FA13DRAFT_1786257 [Coprinellus micaceus]